jgi:hypothetical protein
MNRFFIVISLFFLSITGRAQFDFGIVGGMNLTSLHLDPNFFEEQRSIPRFGFSFGLGTEYRLPGNMFIHGDLNILDKNFALNVADFYGEDAIGYDRYNLLYLDLPIKFGVELRGYRFFGGAYFDYLLDGSNLHSIEFFNTQVTKSTEHISIGNKIAVPEPQKVFFPLEDQFPYNAGLIVGIGHRAPGYSIDLTYSTGLINIYPETSDPAERNEHAMYTRVLKIELFFYL